MGILKKHNEILFILIFGGAIVLSAGLTSDLYIGDEVHHYRFAKDMYTAGKRVFFDPLYPTGNPPGFFYNSEPFWSGLLAIVWRLGGGISFPLAQIYHTSYYLLLIFLTYLLGIEIYGRKEGIYAALLISSVPMVVSFSILFYLDVPGTVLAALSLLFLLKKRYFLTGLAISLLYFTRRHGCFLAPGFILVHWLTDKESSLPKFRNLTFLILPTVILASLDLKWRNVHIETSKFVIAEVGTFGGGGMWEYIKIRMVNLLWGSREYLNSSMLNPKDLIQYFGIPFLLALCFYFLFKKNKKEDLLLWVCVISYFVSFPFLFGINSDIRYLFPVIPLLCILAGSSFRFIGNLKWIKVSICIVCLLQLLGTSLYVHQKRLIPAEIKESFSFIKRNTPVNALFMYPGYIFIEATGRRFIWSSFFQVEVWMMKEKYIILKKDRSAFVFWTKNEEYIKEMMKMTKLDYIVIDKSKIYNDTKVKHFGGYPESFVERLPTLPFVKKIFENQAISVWEVKREKPEDYFPMRKEEG